MPIIKGLMDFFTLGSDRPIRRLTAYYVVLALVVTGLLVLFPAAAELLFGSLALSTPNAPVILADGLNAVADAPIFQPDTIGRMAISTTMALIATLAIMLPVTWVYISARNVRGHSQAIVQTLMILPIVVAGVVFVVRDSLALAFSLAGVVAAVRFRTTLRDTRDVVFIFLAIGIGFAAGVHMLGVGAIVSVVFNYLLLVTWRYDFGRNVLAPTASAQWGEPLKSLAEPKANGSVPDRDLVLALTPNRVSELADRFQRVQNVLGKSNKKPRYNAVLHLTSDKPGLAQATVQPVLEQMTKRWKLDEVISHDGKPDEIYYLVRLRKSTTRDEVITAIRAQAGDKVSHIDLETSEAIDQEQNA
ncbi:MAG TPA: DUF4956 domain-containing protein [Gemmatimonadaceae bacterium]|nr:DUF4956 domain-containing protein [Gemmatimonadaceae bacterium]